jgi:Na+-transporting NADH:ubiquinone oxidoreductase subunit NqrB
MNWYKRITEDPRYYQIFFLTSFLIYGILFLGWPINLGKYIILFFATISTQFFGNKLFGFPQKNLASSVITALGLSLLLKTESLGIAYLAGVIAISAKFIFRFKGHHFVNPANFGLVIVVLFSQQAWISPGQWGFDGTLFFLIGTLGGVVCSKAKRIDVALCFITTLFCLQFYRSIIYLGWPIDFLAQQFSTGSLLLFTFFMITDPISTPSGKVERRLWAIAIAVLSFYLSNFYFLNGAPIYALFILGFATPIIEAVRQYSFKKYFPIFQPFSRQQKIN